MRSPQADRTPAHRETHQVSSRRRRSFDPTRRHRFRRFLPRSTTYPPGTRPEKQSDDEQGHPHGNEDIKSRFEERKEHEAAEQRGPQPQDDDGAALTVTEAHQTVMDMVLVRRVKTLSRHRAAHKRPHGVDERYPEDEDRDEQRREEKERHAAGRWGAPPDHHGRGAHE